MIRLATVAETEAAGAKLAMMLTPGDAVALSGPLGAGKTALVRGMLRGLGHDGDVPSPSFPIVIPYDPPTVRLPFAHVDLYRIDDVAALSELGLDDLRGGGAVAIEWPERLGDGAWPDMLRLSLSVEADDARILTAQVPAAWATRWPPQ
jgi:tRNA threonylcarbamoyladenosine biosynthesis protein TsaE